MSIIENLVHSLAVIQELGLKTDDSLENKKEEMKSVMGGVISITDLIKVHREFIEKNKQELEAKVKEGKLSNEFVKAAIGISEKSHELIKKFLTDKTAQYNVKKGEVLALESSVKLLKTAHDVLNNNKRNIEEMRKAELEAKQKENELRLKQQEEPTQDQNSKEEVEIEISSKKAPGRKRKRPDEAPLVESTVKRIKDARRKNSNR